MYRKAPCITHLSTLIVKQQTNRLQNSKTLNCHLELSLDTWMDHLTNQINILLKASREWPFKPVTQITICFIDSHPFKLMRQYYWHCSLSEFDISKYNCVNVIKIY